MIMVSYLVHYTLYYKIRQILLQNATAILLQNASGFLLQNSAVITKCNVYYKMRWYNAQMCHVDNKKMPKLVLFPQFYSVSFTEPLLKSIC